MIVSLWVIFDCFIFWIRLVWLFVDCCLNWFCCVLSKIFWRFWEVKGWWRFKEFLGILVNIFENFMFRLFLVLEFSNVFSMEFIVFLLEEILVWNFFFDRLLFKYIIFFLFIDKFCLFLLFLFWRIFKW